MTEKLQRFDFARICVEVDATKPLLDEFKLHVQGEVVKLQVVYQWRPKRCPKCCTFGHQCPMASPLGTRPDPVQYHAPSAPSHGLNHAQSYATATSGPSSAPNFVLAQSNATATSGPAIVGAAGSRTGHAAIATPSAAAAATFAAPDPAVVAASAVAAVPDTAAAAAPVSAVVPDPAAIAASAAVPVPDPTAVAAPALDSEQALTDSGPVFPSAPPVVPVPAPVPVHVPASVDSYVDGLVEDISEDDDDYEDVLPSAMYYTTHSPKTRGQKAKKDLSLGFTPSQAKGSGKKGKKKGKRSKR